MESIEPTVSGEEGGAASIQLSQIAAPDAFDLLDLALLTRYQKIFMVHDDDKAGDRGHELNLFLPRPRPDRFLAVGRGFACVGIRIRGGCFIGGTTHLNWMKVLANAKRELRKK